MKIKISNIEYDTTENVSLPLELLMVVSDDFICEPNMVSDIASEYISNTTGFCHNGFTWEKI